MATIDTKFGKKLQKYGATNFNACYNCGTCTAVCSLSDAEQSFPREMVRYSVLGLTKEAKSSLKPWLCYYCGECTTHCPQEANPGELMMALRRWQIGAYDWTGLSGLLYRNVAGYFLAFAFIIALVIGLADYFQLSQQQLIHYGHLFEIFAISGVFVAIILPNIIQMWYWTVLKQKIKFDMKIYFPTLRDLFIHMFTQKRTLDCERTRENKIWWFEHLVLVIGYISLLFTTVFLDWFGTNSIVIVTLGYVMSAIVFIVTFDFMIRRIRKSNEKTTFSHPSDWFFVIWLFFMGISAFAVRLLIDLNVLENYFFIYYFHLIILVQWALVIVPFGKWLHFIYRPFAMYFLELAKKSKK